MTIQRHTTNPVLVINTSTDYIEHISRNFPDRAIFITNPAERARGKEWPPPPWQELVTPMDPPELVLAAILAHLEQYKMQAAGVACFDDESMHLSSLIARRLGLPYPDPDAVLRCRCKLRSKQLWQQAGLDCPACRGVASVTDATDFFLQHGPLVLKPLTGAGSELLFFCRTADESAAAFQTLRTGLIDRYEERIYSPYLLDGRQTDPRTVMIAEQLRYGEEYSCDFLVNEDHFEMIRLTRKSLFRSAPAGTVLAYQLLDRPPVAPSLLHRTLRGAVQALGIFQGICMVDFLVDDNRIVLLELAPRPGGDCLPPLLRLGCGLDMMGLALDHAAGIPIRLPLPVQKPGLIGLRLFATPPGGVIARLDVTELQNDQRVLEIRLTKGVGHRVILPPEEYFSRILGYALFMPVPELPVEEQCLELLGRIEIRYETLGGSAG